MMSARLPWPIPSASQDDRGHGRLLIEAAASQHMTHHAQPDQHQRHLTVKARVPGGAVDLLLPAAMMASGGLPALCPDLDMSPPCPEAPAHC